MLSEFGLVECGVKFVSNGDRFGKLVVLATGKVKGTYRYYSICQCDCGSEPKRIRSDSLKDSTIVSCGCYHKEKTTTHGGTKYGHGSRWRNMMARCYDENSPSYGSYGGRGIEVYDRWHDIEAYVSDISDGYFEGADLDRIDNDGNYEPSNVRWVSRKDNCNNRRSSKFVVFRGVEDTITNHAERQGLRPMMVMERLRSGWTPERALTEGTLENTERKKAGDARRKREKERAEAYKKRLKKYEYKGKQYTVCQLAEIAGVSTKLMRKRICERGWPVEKAVSQ